MQSNSLAHNQQQVPFNVMKNNMLSELGDGKMNNSKTQRGMSAGKGAAVANSFSQGDEISPELAAKIVKNFILPMFESTEKKNLKTKYNKMSSISTGGHGKFKFNAM